jgi:hypothetical protein
MAVPKGPWQLGFFRNPSLEVTNVRLATVAASSSWNNVLARPK